MVDDDQKFIGKHRSIQIGKHISLQSAYFTLLSGALSILLQYFHYNVMSIAILITILIISL